MRSTREICGGVPLGKGLVRRSPFELSHANLVEQAPLQPLRCR